MLRNFIYANGLQEADVIVAQKRGWNVFDHFIIYMGFKFGQHLFIANDTQGGVRWFSEKEIINLIADFEHVKIRRFSGNLAQRDQAISRATGELGRTYSLTEFNCEHLANYVQYGVRESEQVKRWGTGLALVGGAFLAAVIFANDQTTKYHGNTRKRKRR